MFRPLKWFPSLRGPTEYLMKLRESYIKPGMGPSLRHGPIAPRFNCIVHSQLTYCRSCSVCFFLPGQIIFFTWLFLLIFIFRCNLFKYLIFLLKQITYNYIIFRCNLFKNFIFLLKQITHNFVKTYSFFLFRLGH